MAPSQCSGPPALIEKRDLRHKPAGNAAVCVAPPVDGIDQRGVSRPQGVACDIGAFELE